MTENPHITYWKSKGMLEQLASGGQWPPRLERPHITRLPDGVLALNARALKVYLLLVMRQDVHGVVEGYSLRDLATAAKMDAAGVSRALSALVNAKLIARIGTATRSSPNAYFVEDAEDILVA